MTDHDSSLGTFCIGSDGCGAQLGAGPSPVRGTPLENKAAYELLDRTIETFETLGIPFDEHVFRRGIKWQREQDTDAALMDFETWCSATEGAQLFAWLSLADDSLRCSHPPTDRDINYWTRRPDRSELSNSAVMDVNLG